MYFLTLWHFEVFSELYAGCVLQLVWDIIHFVTLYCFVLMTKVSPFVTQSGMSIKARLDVLHINDEK